MKKYVYPVLLITALGYLAICLGLYLTQRAFIYHPKHFRHEADLHTISLATEGATLKVSIREKQNDNALVYFGGNAEDLSVSMPKYEKAFPDHAIYMLHYRGYGGSTGELSETAMHQDAHKLYDLVRAKHSKILLIGRSLGSGVAIQLAALKKIEKLVLITPYDSILNLAKQKFPFIPIDYILEDRFESWRFAPKVTAPTIVLATETDQIIPMANTQSLLAAFPPGRAQMRIVPNADHINIADQPDYFRLMY